jgi:hypothetical protein
MDPSEVPALLQGIAVRAGYGATPAVTAMAVTYQRAVKYTLSLRTHTETEFTVGGRGLPPAKRSGKLRGSVTKAIGGGDPVASASVAPHTIYAAVQEMGDIMHPARKKYMHFVNDGGEWYLKEVKVGPHPYMRPTTARCIANGSLGRAAAKAFTVAVWGQ